MRKLCQYWIDNKDNPKNIKQMKGIYFSMCGYGDSYYKTYMNNPNMIVSGLQSVGATLFGKQGIINSSMDYNDDQIEEQFMEWTNAFWDPLDQMIDKLQTEYTKNKMSITNDRLMIRKELTVEKVEWLCGF